MATNTTFKPKNIYDFEASKLNANFVGVSGVGAAGQATTIDLPLTDDHLITGVKILAKNSKFGDKINLQIVHPVYGVVNQFGTNWGVCSDSETKLDRKVNYPAKLYAGLIIRVEYTSTGILDVNILVNYELHKVLE